MAKRFTDTEKWKKEWFRELSPKMKCAWEYLRDQCDHAGIWDADFNLMKFMIGEEVTREEVEKAFCGRIHKLQNGKKYLLLGFVKFQYKALNPGNRTHESVINNLKAVFPEIDIDSLSKYPSPLLTLAKPLESSSLSASEIQEGLSGILQGRKDTGTDKGLDKDTGSEPELHIEGLKRPTFFIEQAGA